MKKAILLVLIAVLTTSVVAGCGTGVASPKYYVQDDGTPITAEQLDIEY